MPKKKTDEYSNIMNVRVTTAVADTITFEEINVGLTLFDKVGLLISRMEIYMELNLSLGLIAATDQAYVGLTASNSIAGLSPQERAVIDVTRIFPVVAGTPANMFWEVQPLTRDFTQLPGKGLLVTPRPLYIALLTAGQGATRTVQVRIYFTIIPLSDSDYLELLETRQFFG